MDKAGFSSRRLCLMALAAGCCLLTRVVLATGLYIAFLLLLAFLFISELRRVREASLPFARSRFILPLAVLALFAGLAGFVNAKRLGNPLVFHRPRETLLVYPNGVPGLDEYGDFNPLRIPYGLMYYFAPVWFLHGSDGGFLFHSFKKSVMDLVELPPSSFLITDTLLIGLAVAGTRSIFRKGGLTVDRASAALIAGGLAVPPLLMLTAYAMSFRYRMEFYPLFEFLALTGAFAAAGPARRWQSKLAPLTALAILGILASHAVLLAYKISPGGSLDDPSQQPLSFYAHYFMRLIFGQ